MRCHGDKARWAAWLATLVLAAAPEALSQVIEGKVALPKPDQSASPPPRYAGQVGDIAPPDLPVAAVYLEGQFPSAATNLPPGTNSVLQQGMQFRPALLPIRVGTTVTFPNADDFYHNVFSYSRVKRFDLGRYRKTDRPATQIFDKPGIVKLYCDIHQHMRGVILVLDTPFIARTDTNGLYRLENLPAGRYLLRAWVDEKRLDAKPVELEPGKTLRVDFNLQ